MRCRLEVEASCICDTSRSYLAEGEISSGKGCRVGSYWQLRTRMKVLTRVEEKKGLRPPDRRQYSTTPTLNRSEAGVATSQKST